jgi:phosphopantothenoylcysteine decarboxylase/phosphopantothenate--cysteine ligase
MHRQVLARAGNSDAIIMAAAVADYAPEQPSPEKVAKAAGPLHLTLRRTPDILGELGRLRSEGKLPGGILVGFAAETAELVPRARAKRSTKNVDLIVANDVSQPGAGFDVETNQVTLVTVDGEEALPLLSKHEVARIVLDRVEGLLARKA